MPTLRLRHLLLLATLLASCLWACGGDDDDPGDDAGTPEEDAGSLDAGVDGATPPTDGGGMDATVPDDGGPGDAGDVDASCVNNGPGMLLVDAGPDLVTMFGVVSTPPQELPGNIPSGTTIPDAGPPMDGGILRNSDGRLTNATVTLLAPDGTALARDTTDCAGRYEFPAPANTTSLFVQVDPVSGVGGGYTGYIRARSTDTRDLNAGQSTLLLVPELAWRLGMLGETYDFSKGWVVQSFASPRTAGGGLNGGEQVTVTGATNGPSFVVTGTRTIPTDTLPRECDTDFDAGVPPGDPVLFPDGGVDCYTDLLEIVFVSNVEPPGPVQVNLTDPSGLTCTQRETVANWPVRANTVNRIRADCM